MGSLHKAVQLHMATLSLLLHGILHPGPRPLTTGEVKMQIDTPAQLFQRRRSADKTKLLTFLVSINVHVGRLDQLLRRRVALCMGLSAQRPKSRDLMFLMLHEALQTRIVHEYLELLQWCLEVFDVAVVNGLQGLCASATDSQHLGLLFWCCQRISHHVKLHGHLVDFRVLLLPLPLVLLVLRELFLAMVTNWIL